MLCFEVAVDGRRVARAGVPGHGVLTAILSWVLRDPRLRPRGMPAGEWNREELALHLGGLSRGEDRVWIDRPLRDGDVVSVRVMRARAADPPRARRLPARAKRRRT
jgi:hypothetical protein